MDLRGSARNRKAYASYDVYISRDISKRRANFAKRRWNINSKEMSIGAGGFLGIRPKTEICVI